MIEMMSIDSIGDYILLRKHALSESHINENGDFGLMSIGGKENVTDFVKHIFNDIIKKEDSFNELFLYRLSFGKKNGTEAHKDVFILRLNVNGLNVGFTLSVNAGGLYYLNDNTHQFTFLASFDEWNHMDKDNKVLTDGYDDICKGQLKLIIDMVIDKSNMSKIVNYGIISELKKDEVRIIRPSSPIIGSSDFILSTDVNNFDDCQLLIVRLAEGSQSDDNNVMYPDIDNGGDYVVCYDSIIDDVKLYPIKNPHDDIKDIISRHGSTIQPILVSGVKFNNAIENMIYYKISDPINEMYDDVTEEAWEIPITQFSFNDFTFGESASERTSTAIHNKVESIKGIPKKIHTKYKELMKDIKDFKAKMNRHNDIKTYENVTSRGYTDIYRKVLLFLVGVPLVAVAAFSGSLIGAVLAIPLALVLKSKLKEARIEHISFIDEEIEQLNHKITEAEKNGDDEDARKLMRIRSILGRNRSKIDRG